jgi:hypothetical protein
MYSLACELIKIIDRRAVIRSVVRNKPQGIADAMFISGAIGGTSAAEEKCVANDSGREGSGRVRPG